MSRAHHDSTAAPRHATRAMPYASLSLSAIASIVAILLATASTTAQDATGRSVAPAPQPSVPAGTGAANEPEPQPEPGAAPDAADPQDGAGTDGAGAAAQGGTSYRPDRRQLDDALVPCNFKDQKFEDLIPVIVEYTGKTVLPKTAALRSVQITIMNDKLVTKREALELIFQALRLNDIGVVETPEFIMIDSISNVTKLQPITVLGPGVEVDRMADNGQYVVKVWQVANTKASSIYDRITASLPDYAKLEVDNASNQLILEGDVALCKRTQELIEILDVPPFQDIRTETFRLRYADAQTISGVITELFSASRTSGGASSGANRGAQRGNPRQPGAEGQVQVGTSESLLVSVIPATNSITVRAEPDIMRDIRGLITDVWDIDPQRDGSLFRTYQLKHTDPLKIQTILQDLLGSGSGTSSGGASRQGGGGARVAGGQGGDTGAQAAVEDIFQIEAYPDSNRLVILSKTPDNFVWLDRMVEELDQPVLAGAPQIVELKYASAIEVSEIVNAILAPPGAQAEITQPEEGLTGIDFATAGQGSTASGNTPTSNATIRFPWQQRTQGANQDPQAEVSALVGKSRIVPNASQNSLLVLAPPEISAALVDVIKGLDRPGRQVMIQATLAEVELGDQFAMGIKFGPEGSVAPSNPTNSLTTSTTTSYTRDNIDFESVFTDFLFEGTVNADVVLQALAQKTSVRILQEPKIFASDNQEGKFFSGMDVPFQSGSTSDAAGTTSNFDQIPVGVGLNIRPRITADGNVAMEVEVLLSNVNTTSAQSLQAGNNPVIDRRQTNTTVTVKDGQTVVLSGIRVETENNKKDGIPFLSEIPPFNVIFGSVDNVSSVKELLVFLKPVVQNNPEDAPQFNAADLERLEALRKKLDDETKKAIFEGKPVPREIAPDPAPQAQAPAQPARPAQPPAQPAAAKETAPVEEPPHPGT